MLSFGSAWEGSKDWVAIGLAIIEDAGVPTLDGTTREEEGKGGNGFCSLPGAATGSSGTIGVISVPKDYTYK